MRLDGSNASALLHCAALAWPEEEFNQIAALGEIGYSKFGKDFHERNLI
jgi:hypothetical protein